MKILQATKRLNYSASVDSLMVTVEDSPSCNGILHQVKVARANKALMFDCPKSFFLKREFLLLQF